ncbi:MAG TPA: RDD family protein [Acidimicrobiales bacterium]|nr:RDD family protein [Acidimicrobiales bacterium]
MGTRVKALLLTFGLIVITLGVGWLVWSILEWHSGRTASFRLTGLRVVRNSDGRPIGLGRSILRNALLCTLLLLPTMLTCLVVAITFVMGASPPNDLFSKARNAPWDRLTRTTVVQERRRPFTRGKYGHLSEWAAANEPVSLN